MLFLLHHCRHTGWHDQFDLIISLRHLRQTHRRGAGDGTPAEALAELVNRAVERFGVLNGSDIVKNAQLFTRRLIVEPDRTHRHGADGLGPRVVLLEGNKSAAGKIKSVLGGML